MTATDRASLVDRIENTLTVTASAHDIAVKRASEGCEGPLDDPCGKTKLPPHLWCDPCRLQAAAKAIEALNLLLRDAAAALAPHPEEHASYKGLPVVPEETHQLQFPQSTGTSSAALACVSGTCGECRECLKRDKAVVLADVYREVYECWNVLTFDWESAPAFLPRAAMQSCRDGLNALLTRLRAFKDGWNGRDVAVPRIPATRRLAKLFADHEAEVMRLRSELNEALELLHSPEKWQKWCDIRMLERCEATEAEVVRLRSCVQQLKEVMENAALRQNISGEFVYTVTVKELKEALARVGTTG